MRSVADDLRTASDAHGKTLSPAERLELALEEIHAGLRELDDGQGVSHEQVSRWLGSWGKKHEGRAPEQIAKQILG